MMKRIIPITLISLLTALCWSCSGKEEIVPAGPQEGPAIGFNSLEAPTGKTRAATDTDAGNFLQAGNKFLVYANYDFKLENGTYTQTVPVFNKQEVTYDGAQWDYNPKEYWLTSGLYHFRACHPATDVNLVTSTNGHTMAINYSIYQDNYDLMVAYHQRNMDAIGTDNPYAKVPLQFHHALSKVRVRLKAAAGHTYTLTNFHFRDLFTVGILIYTDVTNTNDLEAMATAEMNGNVVNILTTQWNLVHKDHDPIYNWDGNLKLTDQGHTFDYFYVLPQAIGPEEKDPPKFHFTLLINGQEVPTIITLPSRVWESGKQYTYELVIRPDAESTLHVVTTNWEEVEAAGDDIIIE